MTSGSRWRDRASCHGMYPVGEQGEDVDEHDPMFSSSAHPVYGEVVARMCHDCPVKLNCRLVGYAEWYGKWGNTSAHDRDETRSLIFGRLFDVGGAVLVDLMRPVLEDIAREDDVLAAMLDYGFTPDEVDWFTAPTHMDVRAERIVSKHSEFTTGSIRYRLGLDDHMEGVSA